MATTRQLEIFLAVVEAGGFRRAADKLDISEASVSKQIKALERACGAALFDRAAGKSPELTSGGQRTLKFANETLQLKKQIQSPKLNAGIEEDLEFITRPYFFETFVKPKIKIINEAVYPSKLRLTILESTTEIVNRLSTNHSAFCIARLYVQQNDQVNFHYIKKSLASVYVPTNIYKMCVDGKINIDDLPYVTPSSNHGVNEICIKEIQSREFNHNIIQSQVFSDQIIAEAIERGAKTFLLDHHARSAVESGDIVKLSHEETTFWITFVCSKKSSDDIQKRVLSSIRKVFDQEVF
ncbi:DNA-binding transcriptional LysR family regulator [Sphingobium sp. B7D2B]|uniref:LysR family transcriptional regulator n=1 Tax=Sphingobium sp. B7D2B TaxID=2940583 RepID=UPI00222584A7|nr:LysR family transcriptional regulator [Sphingobium sp. B7D2B]MCW2366451.1 DNA-binding transcriptional LysR family regulator [Sphingobium sp. B7D2B]